MVKYGTLIKIDYGNLCILMTWYLWTYGETSLKYGDIHYTVTYIW